MEHTAATLNEICAAIFVDVAAGNYDKQFKGLFAWSFSVFFIAFHGAFSVSMLVELFVIFSTALSVDAPWSWAAPHVVAMDVPIKHT